MATQTRVEKVLTGKRPDITQAQVLAVLTWIIGQGIAYGVIDSRDAQLTLSAGATLLAIGWKVADAYLRGERNKADAVITATTPEIPEMPLPPRSQKR